MISVICPYNNKALFSHLQSLIAKQPFVDYEVVGVDTTERSFKSAAECLNYAVSISSGDILLFCHQDIEFLDKNSFQYISDFCATHDFGIVGVAGAKASDKRVYSKVWHGQKRVLAGTEIFDTKEVDAVDECLFFIKKDNFEPFSDYGKTWHMYAVDYSLRCKSNGQKVLVVPLPIHHYSEGKSLNSNYYDVLLLLAKRFKKSFKVIMTPCATINTRFFPRLKCFAYKTRLLIRRLLRK